MLLQITTKCFENCSHCMVDANPNGMHMTLDTFQNALSFLNELKPFNIQVTGGEPTTHPSFFDMCISLRKTFLNSNLILLSNGSFSKDNNIYNQVEELIFKYQYVLQIRTHPKYYPNYKTVIEDIKLRKLTSHIYDDMIRLIPFGRALKNHQNDIEWGLKPTCSNIFLLSRQFSNMPSIIKAMETHGFLCKPIITVNGNVHAGETSKCIKIGDVNTNLTEIYLTLRNSEPCDKCGLVKNIPSNYMEFLKNKNDLSN